MSNALLYTASTISFTSITKTIADSASGLGDFIVGSKIVVSGSSGNNSTFTIDTVSASALTVLESVTDEAAGGAVSLRVQTPIPYALREVARVVAAIPGVGAAPANPQENINERVFALTYLMSNVVEISETGTKQNLAFIASDLITPLSTLYEDIARLTPLIDSISYAMISEAASGGDMFSNTIDTFSNLRVEFIPYYLYSGVICIAYRFTLEDVKQKINL